MTDKLSTQAIQADLAQERRAVTKMQKKLKDLEKAVHRLEELEPLLPPDFPQVVTAYTLPIDSLITLYIPNLSVERFHYAIESLCSAIQSTSQWAEAGKVIELTTPSTHNMAHIEVRISLTAACSVRLAGGTPTGCTVTFRKRMQEITEMGSVECPGLDDVPSEVESKAK